MGKPTADYTIVIFPSDNSFWLPQARRIQSARPGTDGKFTFRDMPPGDYRMTAVTDVEPGEWFDPEFLAARQRFHPGVVERRRKENPGPKVAASGRIGELRDCSLSMRQSVNPSICQFPQPDSP